MVYGLPRSAGVAFGPWLLVRQPGGRSTVCQCHARRAYVLVPGCDAKQPGGVCCSFPFSRPFFTLFILTMYVGSLAATRSSQGCQGSATLGHGFQSLAACAAARGGRSTVCRAQRVMFLVPGCFAKQPGKVCHSFPFLPPFFHLLILTMYLGSLAATRSSQGGQRSNMLGRRGFQYLAARAAARGAVY